MKKDDIDIMHFIKKTSFLECDCTYVKLLGMPCSHLFSVKLNLNADTIDDLYFLQRWEKYDKTNEIDVEVEKDFIDIVQNQNKLKIDELNNLKKDNEMRLQERKEVLDEKLGEI